ncbi:hypothetical protein D5086_008923 [Populus alba]|uniref:Uncharacterized protein n=1 Tax=Populus alba TaxID=43335 RepID=A0ACC4CHT1_POPAL
MSAVVEIWVSELAKLKEKVTPRKPFLSKPKEGGVEDEREVKKSKVVQGETTMSEATVCLLMDRFAPILRGSLVNSRLSSIPFSRPCSKPVASETYSFLSVRSLNNLLNFTAIYWEARRANEGLVLLLLLGL